MDEFRKRREELRLRDAAMKELEEELQKQSELSITSKREK
jgi:hypothetical protein